MVNTRIGHREHNPVVHCATASLERSGPTAWVKDDRPAHPGTLQPSDARAKWHSMPGGVHEQ